MRRASIDGDPAVAVKVRLTSYRSLPLSCIERIEVSVDGHAVADDDLRLVVNSHPYRLSELADLSDVWWFILDHADLLIRNSKALEEGPHELQGTLVTVEPYISNGRFYFRHTSTRTLEVQA